MVCYHIVASPKRVLVKANRAVCRLKEILADSSQFPQGTYAPAGRPTRTFASRFLHAISGVTRVANDRRGCRDVLDEMPRKSYELALSRLLSVNEPRTKKQLVGNWIVRSIPLCISYSHYGEQCGIPQNRHDVYTPCETKRR